MSSGMGFLMGNYWIYFNLKKTTFNKQTQMWKPDQHNLDSAWQLQDNELFDGIASLHIICVYVI